MPVPLAVQTIYHKSQEVKNVPDGWRGYIGKDDHSGDGGKMETAPDMMSESRLADSLVAGGIYEMEWNIL